MSAKQVAAVTLVALAVWRAPDAAAIEKVDPGVRGKIVVSPELPNTEWPLTPDEEKARRAPARVRRPAGRAEPKPLTERRPELLVVLEGARSDATIPRKLVVQGHRFLPSQILMPKAGDLAVENKMGKKITILDGQGRALVALEPGETKTAPLPEGTATLAVEEIPSARAFVRVLDRARVLPVKDNGDVDFVGVEPGEYKLVFYHGAEPVYQQPLALGDEKVLFIDATVSAKAVVTVAVKDATIRIAVPQQGVPVPPEPAPSPAP
jgi:hypothetical protein